VKKPSGRRVGATRDAVRNSAERFTDDYLPFLLAQTSAVACAAFADALRAERLSNLAWRIMATLRDEGALSIGRLSEIVLARQPRVTQIINDLVAAGYVKRRNSNADGRVTIAEISPLGRKRIGALLDAAKAREAFAHAALGAADLRLLKTLLRRLLSHRTYTSASGARDAGDR
jgi:DNA-binding MarR family transcriptional regulator